MAVDVRWNRSMGGLTLNGNEAGFVSEVSYDSNNNVVARRDPNSVGQDCTYDIRDRRTICIDTQGDRTERFYDRNNNLVKTRDAKDEGAIYLYDVRNRQYLVEDRLGGRTFTVYDENSNVVLLRDADIPGRGWQRRGNGLTRYTYDERNLKRSER